MIGGQRLVGAHQKGHARDFRLDLIGDGRIKGILRGR